MAKRVLSKHSRAARRATSPSIDTDKSLKKARPPPESASHRPSVLGLRGAAGVTKKKSGRKAVRSAKAQRRLDKSQDRAEQVLERTAVKLTRSRGQAKNTKERARAWDDINSAVDAAADNTKPKPDDAADAWEDEDMEVEVEDHEEGELAAARPPAETEQGDLDGDATMVAAAVPVISVTAPVPATTDDEDEIL